MPSVNRSDGASLPVAPYHRDFDVFSQVVSRFFADKSYFGQLLSYYQAYF